MGFGVLCRGAERTDAIFARLPPNLSYREYGMRQVDLGSRSGCISQPVHHLMPANRFKLISARTSRMVWSAYIVQSVREVRGEGSRTRTRSVRIVTETIFESLRLQLATVPIPIAPETEVVLVSGGLNTNTGTMPGFVISPAVIVTFNW